MIRKVKDYFTKIFSEVVKLRFNHYAKYYETAVFDAGYIEGELSSVVKYLNKVPNLCDLNVLELGCGQGFASQYIKDKPKMFIGVDISRAMLDRVGSGSNYDELHCSEILTYLQSEDRKFDLIFAASVAQFLNPAHLSQVASQVRSSLSESGEFIFTFDSRGSDYKLNSKGFYEYSIAYLESMLLQVFPNVVIKQLPFSRIERGKSVESAIAINRLSS